MTLGTALRTAPWTVLRSRADGTGPVVRASRARRQTVVGLGMVGLLLLGGCAQSSGGGDRASLAGSPTDPAESPSETTDAQIDPMPSGGSTPVGGQPWNGDASAKCEQAVGPGYTEMAQTSDAAGVTSFWSGGRRHAVCDVVLAPADDGEPAVTVSPSRRAAPAGFDEGRLSLSTAVVGPEAGPDAVRFVAGGLLPWPVEEISYTFPDGHVEQARFVASEDGSGDTWWVVAYTATDGPLVDPSTTSDELEPVSISIVGAAAEAFRLPWEDLQRTE